MPDFLLNPPFVTNLKSGRVGNLGALQTPMGSTSITCRAGNNFVPGPFNENYAATAPSQYPAPYNTNVNTTGTFVVFTTGPWLAGIYAALIAMQSGVTHCKATIVDHTTPANFALIADLVAGLNPAALPPGILSAVPVTNAIIDTIGDNHANAFTGWRIIFDTQILLGNADNWYPSLNLVTTELGDRYTGQAIFQSHWSYFAGNPRLASETPDGSTFETLKWFYDGALPPALDHWQLQGQASPNPNYVNLATFSAATRTAPTSPFFGLANFYQLFGCDVGGNQITPTSNIV